MTQPPQLFLPHANGYLGLVHFTPLSTTTNNTAPSQWDTNVQGLAEEVEKVTTMLQRAEPVWYEGAVAA